MKNISELIQHDLQEILQSATKNIKEHILYATSCVRKKSIKKYIFLPTFIQRTTGKINQINNESDYLQRVRW